MSLISSYNTVIISAQDEPLDIVSLGNPAHANKLKLLNFFANTFDMGDNLLVITYFKRFRVRNTVYKINGVGVAYSISGRWHDASKH